MEEIISNEFIEYKTGFQAGKDHVIELTRIGKILDSSDDELTSFFQFGYKDAIDFYSEQVSNGIDIATIRTRDVVKELFTERIMKYNSENNENIPIGTFKM